MGNRFRRRRVAQELADAMIDSSDKTTKFMASRGFRIAISRGANSDDDEVAVVYVVGELADEFARLAVAFMERIDGIEDPGVDGPSRN